VAVGVGLRLDWAVHGSDALTRKLDYTGILRASVCLEGLKSSLLVARVHYVFVFLRVRANLPPQVDLKI
jgi:hypothetical protein